MTKRFLSYMLFLFAIATIANSQVVTCSPASPTDGDQVVLTFNATLGDAGLMNLASTDSVYAHIGVITDKSTSNSNWKYPKAQWAINIPACKLTRIATNTYTLALSPSIREYFGVPAGEKITKLAIVFCNIECTKIGKDIGGLDIFIPVLPSVLKVDVTSPNK